MNFPSTQNAVNSVEDRNAKYAENLSLLSLAAYIKSILASVCVYACVFVCVCVCVSVQACLSK